MLQAYLKTAISTPLANNHGSLLELFESHEGQGCDVITCVSRLCRNNALGLVKYLACSLHYVVSSEKCRSLLLIIHVSFLLVPSLPLSKASFLPPPFSTFTENLNCDTILTSYNLIHLTVPQDSAPHNVTVNISKALFKTPTERLNNEY